MNLRITLLAFLCLCATAILRAERVDMLKAGAKANGKALNSKLINSTIDRLNRGGGGTLFFPAGTYLTGSIHLKSNITLELEAGATLLFSDNFDDYLPFVEVRHEGVMMKSFQPLIYAVDAENISRCGMFRMIRLPSMQRRIKIMSALCSVVFSALRSFSLFVARR